MVLSASISEEDSLYIRYIQMENTIPNKINYIGKYEEFKYYIDNTYEMPDDMVSLLVRFLEQNDGSFSKRAKNKEFVQLNESEIKDIEYRYNLIFNC
ncbi:hypothetical protein [Flagellimonas profundi]|uniref:Uncharacterized protein n=1 Tax=Flagellimonas profundi TaxID=2915620 RepID=A0ABS3FJY8_9FLAO|nr:hypothetical protein [Allomuricauda profundi]MBO0343479.1 hypothetical protein [Allomuricauda profundi]